MQFLIECSYPLTINDDDGQNETGQFPHMPAVPGHHPPPTLSPAPTMHTQTSIRLDLSNLETPQSYESVLKIHFFLLHVFVLEWSLLVETLEFKIEV